jgi:putative transposase
LCRPFGWRHEPFRLDLPFNGRQFRIMQTPRYLWRELSAGQRVDLLAWRKKQDRPWHSPPHVRVFQTCFHLSAACYEHRPWIGVTPERMDGFSVALLGLLDQCGNRVHGWCVLPNHYHALIETADNLSLIAAIGQFHGRTSHAWNGEEDSRGRKVFFRAMDKPIQSEGHLWATLNYIHHNPVHHGYVTRWQDWPWSSAADYLQAKGEAEARRVWREYPVLEMGRNWDEPEM